MLQKFMDDFRESTGSALRLTSLAIAVAVCLFITTAFLCAAAFVFVLQKYGLLQACFAGAGVFFVATILAAISYAVRKRQIRKRPVEAAKSTMQTALSDPMVLAAGLQIVRTIGLKRIIPLIAVGGIALGVMASRRAAPDDEPEEG
ncbi:MAG TPA: hypothetical protein DEA80_21685 [Afipia sp.]|uniref:Uncharacterized protein n=1 Tax=Afipia broomeae ATCC 49717 TaxID=883078 RepID=K8P021_9BRAD|nr:MULTISPECIES: hypothetical protein [Afipia]MAH69555.1 hypothetical protein [Afipia sp.]OUX61540.1 MAG: hypothetical protein CBB64_09960 [Afipia sp. TMED4]EKS34099.1 hypothetical protein HMPREF9695_04009 [Afipia broomeae ATCC 49717]HAO44197.1 hypothetical protein [Afipia sp.]HAP12607.1 hypothetical protein [Afipia sp.]|tara:strand:- start:240 stop:677 length:438 start_codon:yes stop_codon:yes gene_type:complete